MLKGSNRVFLIRYFALIVVLVALITIVVLNKTGYFSNDNKVVNQTDVNILTSNKTNCKYILNGDYSVSPLQIENKNLNCN